MKDNLSCDWKFILKDKYNNKINNSNVVDFLNCKIDLSFKPLVPRVETEYWLEKTIPFIKKHFKNHQAIKTLDIFSGSGCLGIALAKNIKKAIVDFSDIDKNNIKQIKKNLKINNIKNYKKVLLSDIFSNIAVKYDLILANPPYVPLSDTIKAPFEPLKAIKAGKDGLAIIKTFIAQSKNFLNPGGVFIMEYHSSQITKLKTMLKKHGFNNFEFHKDQYNRHRYVIVNLPTTI